MKIKFGDDGDLYQCSEKDSSYINIVVDRCRRGFDVSYLPVSMLTLTLGLTDDLFWPIRQ